MTSAEPRGLYTLAAPAPRPTVTSLATVWPATQLRLEASGSATPAGNTVRKPGAVVTVTLRTTALTEVGGTPPFPATGTFSVVPGPSGPPPARVSSIRLGVRA